MGSTGDLKTPRQDETPEQRKYELDEDGVDLASRKVGFGALGVLMVSAVVFAKNLFFSPDALAMPSEDAGKPKGASSAENNLPPLPASDQASRAAGTSTDAGQPVEESTEAGEQNDLPARIGGKLLTFTSGPAFFMTPAKIAQYGFSAISVTPVNDNISTGPFDFTALFGEPDLSAVIGSFSMSGSGASPAAGGVVAGNDSFSFSTAATGQGDGRTETTGNGLEPGDGVSVVPGPGGVNHGPGTGTPPAPVNRAPRVDGPVHLNGSFINQLLVIGAADLLVHASDADGDPLKAQQLSADHGAIVANADGSWNFIPDPDFTGEVVIGYRISDGTAFVTQEALLTIKPFPGEDITGTASADILVGTDGDDEVTALEGDDVIHARGGHDVIYGGDGDDRIFAGSGDDIVHGGAGDDIIHGGDGNDTIFGDEGNDTVLAGNGDDIVFGGTGNDRIWGEAGNDILDGGAGDDEVHGGAGNDLIEGGAGADLLFGDDGEDVLIGGAGVDRIDGGAGADVILALAGDGDDALEGGEGIDTLDMSRTTVGATIDLAAGTVSSAETGEDTVSGIENVIGGAGNDVIIANDEVNVMFGGSGEDVFVFQTTQSAGWGRGSRDKIEDMEVGDRINLKEISREFSDLVEDTLEDIGVRKFVIIGEEEEFSKPGELKFKSETLADGSDVTIVEGNIDYDADAEFEIEIHGRHNLSWIDFDGVHGG